MRALLKEIILIKVENVSWEQISIIDQNCYVIPEFKPSKDGIAPRRTWGRNGLDGDSWRPDTGARAGGGGIELARVGFEGTDLRIRSLKRLS